MHAAVFWFLGLAPCSPQDGPAALDPGARLAITLPADPLVPATRVARAAADVPPFRGPLCDPPWPESFASPRWSEREPWLAWAALVGAEARASMPDPRRRASLAVLAARQGRHVDAWRHFAACAADPAIVAALLPRLFPGVPDEVDPFAALPEGTLLRPVLPPSAPDRARDAERGLLVPGRMSASGLRVGDAVCDVALELVSDGVELEFAHVAGGPARIDFLLPEPAAYAIRLDYLDWERREVAGVPFEVTLAPGAEPLAAWGRFAPRRAFTPGTVETLVLEHLRARGIAVAAAPARRGTAEGLAAALHALFAVETRVDALAAERDASPALAPVVLRLSDDDGALHALCTWVSWSERILLPE